MRKNANLSYLERKARCRAIHKWLETSKLLHLAEDTRGDIDVPVENDVRMDKLRSHRRIKD